MSVTKYISNKVDQVRNFRIEPMKIAKKFNDFLELYKTPITFLSSIGANKLVMGFIGDKILKDRGYSTFSRIAIGVVRWGISDRLGEIASSQLISSIDSVQEHVTKLGKFLENKMVEPVKVDDVVNSVNKDVKNAAKDVKNVTKNVTDSVAATSSAYAESFKEAVEAVASAQRRSRKIK